MIRTIAVATIVCLGSGIAAFGAENTRAAVGVGNPAGATASAPQSMSPGMPAGQVLNNDDRLFIREITIGGRAEIDAGNLAEQKGRSQSIGGFGHRMAIDHGNLDRRMAELARVLGVALPNQPDQEHRDTRAQLGQANGAKFDVLYIRGQIIDHQKTVQLLEWEIGSGENPQLKAFATQSLPLVMQHLEMANAILTQLTGAAPIGGRTQITETNPASSPPNVQRGGAPKP
ncbi:MAG: DUF4142 domain-containing protein [Acidobacteria bacterium]|nr:DUF4142 domain-containing protein [Acidobacteriota bacterium]